MVFERFGRLALSARTANAEEKHSVKKKKKHAAYAIHLSLVCGIYDVAFLGQSSAKHDSLGQYI